MRSKAKQTREDQAVPARATVLAGSMAAPTAKRTSRNSVYVFAVALFLIVGGVFALLAWPWSPLVALIGGAALGVLAATSIRIAPQWERVIILRLGRFHHVGGPGLYAIIPIVDSVGAS